MSARNMDVTLCLRGKTTRNNNSKKNACFTVLVGLNLSPWQLVNGHRIRTRAPLRVGLAVWVRYEAHQIRVLSYIGSKRRATKG